MDGFQQFSRELGEVEAAFNEKYAGLDKYTEEYLRANPDEIEAYNAQAEAYNADFRASKSYVVSFSTALRSCCMPTKRLTVRQQSS